ncbi:MULTISPECIES: NACHT domain-containing NTPase [unclassified Leeuwenhoekiella]|uniref:NACHT domain-containing protein n=1 Tax=unclassified Leeuwenhoekiella TaxID=2615029 RepID=UPI000C3F4FF8|nr:MULTISPECIES: NACHT domain-containing protein [unclassified Leeuwenhoekiella]MAW96097.1 hypothetical protein [Leeuwenhoekiella sp.]MBA80091.1 hypothetical protein [Leeuwenhoekiella sp.]|tara:strand:+ start:5835 stop:7586 length:1752 start_codon:yes stop_codon:yes gene_type:complete
MNTKEISQIFKGPLDKILGLVGDELNQSLSNRILEYQVEEYKRNFWSKTILHRSTPKSLNEFYEPLYLIQGQGSTRIPTKSAKNLLKNRNYITLIGNAGSGKSTIIKYLLTNCFKERYKIPIKVELRYLNEYEGRLSDYIYKEIFQFQKLGLTNTIIDRMLGSKEFIFFLDGYDEISSKIKEGTTKDIDSFVKKFPNNKYVLTSRPHTHIETLPLFENFYVSELKEEEIASFVKKQIPSQENELADKIIEAVNKKENESYREFLSNPLLLSMFILTFQSYSDVPQKRSDFYDQVFDTLYSIHDSVSKLAFVREKMCGLSKEQFEEVLQLFSFLSFFEEKFIFPNNYLTDKLDLIKSKKNNLKFDNTKIINDLQIAIGILNKEGIDYTFPHRSLQEYFAASYISKLDDINKKEVYRKILSSILDGHKILRSSREHFYLLLSELDQKKVIEYILLPFLEKYESVNYLDKLDHEEILSEYVNINLVYTAFSYILNSNDIRLITNEIEFEFHERIEMKKQELNLNTEELFEEKYEFHREQIVKVITESKVKSFLKSFIPKMIIEGKNLEQYLKDQHSSDTDIIDMIR